MGEIDCHSSNEIHFLIEVEVKSHSPSVAWVDTLECTVIVGNHSVCSVYCMGDWFELVGGVSPIGVGSPIESNRRAEIWSAKVGEAERFHRQGVKGRKGHTSEIGTSQRGVGLENGDGIVLRVCVVCVGRKDANGMDSIHDEASTTTRIGELFLLMCS